MGEEEGCEELSLELSIGGKYGNLREKARGENAKCEEISISGMSESVDPQRRREIQALRRHEARRKREVKKKKSRGANNVEDKMFLEAQKFQGRVGDREIREKDYFLEEKSRKNEVADELGLGLSLFSENKERENGCLYPKVQFAEANAFGLSDSENSNGVKSLEQCSSAVSDYHSVSQKGGNNSDTGSQSSRQHHQIQGPTQAETHRSCLVGSNPRMRYAADISTDATNLRSTSEALSKDKSNAYAARLSRMPCVSATGDGPNGTTVTGFLYRYDKTEVSIMCVCHGSSFSPAEFVKHAGGADVSHPLRHITVVHFSPTNLEYED